MPTKHKNISKRVKMNPGVNAKIILISGHPRSGTTLIENIFNSHPDIYLTHEFGNFFQLDCPFHNYFSFILRRLNWIRNRPIRLDKMLHGNFVNRRVRIFNNLIFSVRYLLKIKKHCDKMVTLETVREALKDLFPHKIFIGDKTPYYIFHLNDIPPQDNVLHFIIYRDCRDVVSSTLIRARNIWGGQLAEQNDTAEKVVRKWLHAIKIMEMYADRIHAIRYEDLIFEPDKTLKNVAKYLKVDPNKFNKNLIRSTSIGKYQNLLPKQDLEIVYDIAGPVMKKLGYV